MGLIDPGFVVTIHVEATYRNAASISYASEVLKGEFRRSRVDIVDSERPDLATCDLGSNFNRAFMAARLDDLPGELTDRMRASSRGQEDAHLLLADDTNFVPSHVPPRTCRITWVNHIMPRQVTLQARIH